MRSRRSLVKLPSIASRRCFGLDVHREFAQVAIWQDGQVRQAGQITATPEGLRVFADSLAPTDEISKLRDRAVDILVRCSRQAAPSVQFAAADSLRQWAHGYRNLAHDLGARDWPEGPFELPRRRRGRAPGSLTGSVCAAGDRHEVGRVEVVRHGAFGGRHAADRDARGVEAALAFELVAQPLHERDAILQA